MDNDLVLKIFKIILKLKNFKFILRTALLLGKLIATFSPLRLRIFLVNVLNRGWPEIASSGKNRLLEAPECGVGVAGGSVKSGAPSLLKV